MGKLVKFQRGIATVIPEPQGPEQPEHQPEEVLKLPAIYGVRNTTT